MHFQPARRASGPPEIRQLVPEASADIDIGAPIQRDANPEFIEEHAGGATVTGILGVSTMGAASGTPDFDTTVGVAIANGDQEFLGQIYDVSGSTVATPAEGTHHGVQFGMVKVGDQWYVDEEDTTNVVLVVTKVMPDIKAVLFKFLESATVAA